MYDFYLASPSTTTVTGGTSGAHTGLIASRRVNQLGYVTANTQATGTYNTAIARTVTVPIYTDTYSFLRDEVLVSPDNGVTWKIAPVTATGTPGTYNLPAYSTSWPNATVGDNQQTAPASPLNFGLFNGSTSLTLTRYLPLTRPTRTLGFDVLTDGGLPFSELSGRIRFSVLGLLAATGQGVNIGTVGQIVWAAEVSNTLTLIGDPTDFVKLEIQLINYPGAGFPSTTNNFRIEVTPNNTLTPLAVDWSNGSVSIDPGLGWGSNIVTKLNSTTVTVNPFTVNYGGSQVMFPVARSFTVTNGTLYHLVLSNTGTVNLLPTAPTGIGNISLLTFTPTTAAITYNSLPPVRNTNRVPVGVSVPLGQPVGVNGSAWTSGDLLGVSVGSAGTVIGGVVAVKVTAPVSVGASLTPATGGFVTGAGNTIALTEAPGTGPAFVFAYLRPSGGGSSVPVNLSATPAPSSIAVSNSNGTGFSLGLAGTTNAGLLNPYKFASAPLAVGVAYTGGVWNFLQWGTATGETSWLSPSIGKLTLPPGFLYAVSFGVEVSASVVSLVSLTNEVTTPGNGLAVDRFGSISIDQTYCSSSSIIVPGGEYRTQYYTSANVNSVSTMAPRLNIYQLRPA